MTNSNLKLDTSNLKLDNSNMNLDDSSLNLENSTLDLKNSTLNLENSTLNLKNSTLNLKNSTLNLDNSNLNLDNVSEPDNFGETTTLWISDGHQESRTPIRGIVKERFHHSLSSQKRKSPDSDKKLIAFDTRKIAKTRSMPRNEIRYVTNDGLIECN